MKKSNVWKWPISLFCFFTISFVPYYSYSQVAAKRLEAGKPGMHASLIEYNAASAPRFEKGKIPVISENGSITSLSDMILINSQKDELGFEHYRYQQTYKGIPIENAVVAVHVKDGKILLDFAYAKMPLISLTLIESYTEIVCQCRIKNRSLARNN